MNQEINTAFEYALMARAAYAKLDTTDPSKYQQVLEASGWSSALATYFLSKFTVVASELNGLESYQGVFFKRNGTEEYILANRGTQELYIDLVISDALLAGTGLTTQLGGLKHFIEKEIAAHNITSFSVTGHSLGGYLSTMTKIMYPTMVNGLYTYNGAGVADIAFTSNILNILRGVFGYEPLSFATPNAINYRAAEMPDVVIGTGIYLGTAQRINVDNIDLLGHGMAPITDTLAVYNLLGMVDSDITISELNGIKEASSKVSTTDNDALVKAFGSLLNKVFNWELDTDINAVSSDNNAMHKAIYEMVKKLQNAPQALQITPLVSFNESGQLQLHTNQDINSLAYRYALKELNPFIVEGINYSSFNQSGQLDDYNEGGAANDTSYRLAA